MKRSKTISLASALLGNSGYLLMWVAKNEYVIADENFDLHDPIFEFRGSPREALDWAVKCVQTTS